VQRGVELVGQTGDSLSDIVDKVKSISTLVSEISSATGEQSASLNDVRHIFANLEAASKQTVDIAAKSDADCTFLNDEARTLGTLAEHFKTTTDITRTLSSAA